LQIRIGSDYSNVRAIRFASGRGKPSEACREIPIMSRRLVAVSLCLLSTAGLAAEPPITTKLLTSDTELSADATAIQTTHHELRASNAAAARLLAEQAIPFSEQIETVEVIEATTLKADGRKLPVDPSRILTQLQPGVTNNPLYGDSKRLVVVYPDVGAGDSISLTWRRHVHHPPIPGVYSTISLFQRTVAFENTNFSVTAPSGMKLTVDAHDVPTEQETRDGQTIYRWHYHANAVAEDPASLLPVDRVPRVFISSLPDWDSLGHTWASLVVDKATVTPAIQALADRLTAGTTNRREQARRLYDWVSTHIRWVAIYIGNGTLIPHAADDVLTNGYGDCKDQVMLLMALMRAKGIGAEPVLINSGASYQLPGAAVIGAFNHCITYLPDWDIYADTTAGGAPFGTLPSTDYGKPVVHAVLEGETRHRTPVMPTGLARASLITKMHLDANGEVSGESVTTAAGPYATILRGFATRAQGTGPERFAANILREHGNSGSGDVTITPSIPLTETYRLSGTFKLAPQPGWLDGDSFTLPTGLQMIRRPADGLAGPIEMRNLPPTEPTPCYAGQQDETLSLTLPDGYAADRLPRDRDIVGDDFRYISHYTVDGRTVTAYRSFVSTFHEPLCLGEVRTSVAKAFEVIRRDLDARFILEQEK
jgi:hypothetical protein